MAPSMTPVQVWAPKLKQFSVSHVVLGNAGQKGFLKIPSKHGFVKDSKGLKWPLIAYRLCFD